MNKSKEDANARIETAGDGAARCERSKRTAIYAGIFLAAFLLGLVPMWLAARERGRERERAQIELRVNRLQNTLASVAADASGGKYELAQQSASGFHTNLRGEIERDDDSACAGATCASDETRQFIGYRHKGGKRGEKLPNGARDLGGGLLSDENYGVSRFSNGKKFMLWLEKIIDRDEEDVPDWEVKDALVFDKLKKNQKFLLSYSSPCTDNGAENLDIIVLAETHPKHKTYKILKAWRADLEREKFESFSIEGIVCR